MIPTTRTPTYHFIGNGNSSPIVIVEPKLGHFSTRSRLDRPSARSYTTFSIFVFLMLYNSSLSLSLPVSLEKTNVPNCKMKL